MSDQPKEGKITDPENGDRKPKMKVSGYGAMALAAVLLVAVMYSCVSGLTGKKSPAKLKSDAAAMAPTFQPVSATTPAQAQQSIAALSQEETQARANEKVAAQNQIFGQTNQQTTQVDPVVAAAQDQKRKRLLAMALSPTGWVEGGPSMGVAPSATPAHPQEPTLPGFADPEIQALQRLAASEEELPIAAVRRGTQGSGDEGEARKEDPNQRYQWAFQDPSTVSGPDGKSWDVIRKGTVIEGLVDNTLIGDFAGPVHCHITNDVYSQDGKRIAIPSGSVILGHAEKAGGQWQTRLAVMFDDLLLPGYEITLPKEVGLDQEGATALKDKVNRHILSKVGTVFAIGILGGLAVSQSGSTLTQSGTDRMAGSVGATAGMEGQEMLSQQLNRPNELEIRTGQRVRIMLSKSLAIPQQQVTQ